MQTSPHTTFLTVNVENYVRFSISLPSKRIYPLWWMEFFLFQVVAIFINTFCFTLSVISLVIRLVYIFDSASSPLLFIHLLILNVL